MQGAVCRQQRSDRRTLHCRDIDTERGNRCSTETPLWLHAAPPYQRVYCSAAPSTSRSPERLLDGDSDLIIHHVDQGRSPFRIHWTHAGQPRTRSGARLPALRSFGLNYSGTDAGPGPMHHPRHSPTPRAPGLLCDRRRTQWDCQRPVHEERGHSSRNRLGGTCRTSSSGKHCFRGAFSISAENISPAAMSISLRPVTGRLRTDLCLNDCGVTSKNRRGDERFHHGHRTVRGWRNRADLNEHRQHAFYVHTVD
jgi:hypothetical protein